MMFPVKYPGATLLTGYSHTKNHTSRDPDYDKSNDRGQGGDMPASFECNQPINPIGMIKKIPARFVIPEFHS